MSYDKQNFLLAMIVVYMSIWTTLFATLTFNQYFAANTAAVSALIINGGIVFISWLITVAFGTPHYAGHRYA